MLAFFGWSSSEEFMEWFVERDDEDQMEYVQTILAIIPAFLE